MLLGAGPREALVSRSGQPGRGPGSGDFTPQGACLRSSGRRLVQTRPSQAAGCSVVMGTRLLRPALSLGSHLTQKQPPQGGTLWGHRVPRRPPAGLLGDPRLQGAGAPRQLRSSPLFLRPLPHTRGSAYLLLTGGQVTSPAAASTCGSMTCGPQTLGNGGGGGRRSSQKPAGRSAGPGACSRLTCWAAGPAEPAPSARPDALPLSPGSGRSSGLQLVRPSVFGLPVTVQPPPAQTASTSVPWGTRSLHNGPRTPGDRRPSGSACGGGTQEGSQQGGAPRGWPSSGHVKPSVSVQGHRARLPPGRAGGPFALRTAPRAWGVEMTGHGGEQRPSSRPPAPHRPEPPAAWPSRSVWALSSVTTSQINLSNRSQVPVELEAQTRERRPGRRSWRRDLLPRCGLSN